MSWLPQINLFYHQFLCLPVFLLTTLGSRSLLGFLRPVPCRLRQMKQNQDLINPGSVSLGTAVPEKYPTLRPILGLPDYNDVPLTLSPPRSIGLNLLVYASNTANALTELGRHRPRGKCHKTRTSTGSI